MSNILLLTGGTGGDLFPFIQIGLELKKRGHEATFFSLGKFEDKVRRAGMDFVAIDKFIKVGWDDNASQIKVLSSLTSEFLEQHRAATLSAIDLIIERAHSRRTILVGQFSLNIVVQNASEKLGVPYVPVFTAPYFVTTLSWLSELYMLFSPYANGVRAALGLRPIDDWQAWLRKPRASIGIWPDWFALPDANSLSGLVAVGFVLYHDVEMGEVPEVIQEESSHGEAPILITHGTSKPVTANFFSSSIEACGLLDRKAILVTPHPEFVPTMMDKMVRWFKQLPFESVMPYMAAVIHHGGIGTTGQALASGIPQLVLGYDYDRPDNGARLKRMGVGDYLPPAHWQPFTIADSLRHLLDSPAVQQRCNSFSSRIDADNSINRACDVIERCDYTH